MCAALKLTSANSGAINVAVGQHEAVRSRLALEGAKMRGGDIANIDGTGNPKLEIAGSLP